MGGFDGFGIRHFVYLHNRQFVLFLTSSGDHGGWFFNRSIVVRRVGPRQNPPMPRDSRLETQAKRMLGTSLKLLREDRGWAHDDIADAIGVTPDAVRKYERGVRAPGIHQLILLAGMYGVTLDRLVYGQDRRPKPLPVIRMKLEP